MIDFFKKQITLLALQFALTFIQKIRFSPLQVYLSYLIEEGEKAINVLFDANPDNTNQLVALWVAEKNGFIDNTTATTTAVADVVIKDAKVRYVVKNLLRDLQKVLKDGEITEGSAIDQYAKGVVMPKRLDSFDDIVL